MFHFLVCKYTNLIARNHFVTQPGLGDSGPTLTLCDAPIVTIPVKRPIVRNTEWPHCQKKLLTTLSPHFVTNTARCFSNDCLSAFFLLFSLHFVRSCKLNFQFYSGGHQPWEWLSKIWSSYKNQANLMVKWLLVKRPVLSGTRAVDPKMTDWPWPRFQGHGLYVVFGQTLFM